MIRPKSESMKNSERGNATYRTLEALGPEHEYSVIDEQLRALPIVDRIIKDVYGRIVNFVEQRDFTFGKELQMHVMEVKPNQPFESPREFEETMHKAVLQLGELLQRKYKARLLGTGMHPLLRLEETGVWPHRHRQIYHDYSKVFSLKRHGWLNIQSFQLNLPYADEQSGVLLHNALSYLCVYLPAIAAASPICEGTFAEDADERLRFYALNQEEVPSVTGDVVPEYVSSIDEYQRTVIDKYSSDLARAGAGKSLIGKDWVNSRGVTFRFDRKALEIRVMDEQECIRSDVALSCFIRGVARSMMRKGEEFMGISRDLLLRDYSSIVRDGLKAKTLNPRGKTAGDVCRYLLKLALQGASEEEKEYLPLIRKRIERGSLSEIVRERVRAKTQRMDFSEAVVQVYLGLAETLVKNEPFF
jgi:gamma-glutamyl:cysteine ligase YbdK (ATP-grasp superfamily)